MDRISSQISKLSAYTDTVYKNIQRIYTPSLYNLHVERMYKTEMSMISLGFLKNTLAFVSNNIPIIYHKRGQLFQGTLTELVQKRYMHPMLIFYKGKHISWENIGIKSTHRYTYLFIKGIDLTTFESNKDVQCILLPYVGTVYRENITLYELNNIGAEETPIFLFDKDGYYVSTPEEKKVYTMISNLNNKNDFYVEQYKSHAGTLFKSLVIPKNKYISDQNVIYFEDSILPPNAIEKKAFKKRGYNLFFIEGDKSTKLDMKVFFYDKGNESKNIMNNIAYPSYELYKYDKDFDFSFDIHKSYKENYLNALKYCVTYNSAFLNNIYKDIRNIKSVNYTGKHIKSLVDSMGYVKMSTRLDAENYNKVIIYHNGNLYKQYHTIQYINKDFKFYCETEDIKDNDVFEILFFKKSYNVEKEIILNSNSDDVYYIGVDVDMNDVKMYSTNLYKEHKFFNIEVNELAQYAIPFKYKLVDKPDRMYKIYPEHPFYYDKKCTLVSNRQFRYYYKKIKYDECVNFELPADFKFCSDPSKYMVYINGRRLNNANFKITIVKNTRPFYSPSVYMNIPTFKGDMVEVFYVPDSLSEVYVDKNLNATSGAIIVDKSKLSYNLDKDLYLFFINGKKVNPDDIVNISKNVVKIKSADSVKNVSIIKYINSIDVLTKIFTYTSDIMDSLVNDIDELEIHDKLVRFYGESNLGSEEAFDSNATEMKNILYKLIRDYWNKPYVTDGNEFIYDFDTDELDTDSNGNIIVPSMNANVEY